MSQLFWLLYRSITFTFRAAGIKTLTQTPLSPSRGCIPSMEKGSGQSALIMDSIFSLLMVTGELLTLLPPFGKWHASIHGLFLAVFLDELDKG